ncbi:hypothetical protein ENUP19_0341G0007 [Entamoeba nuttalli]|uniref:HEAT repeat domain containing protein n=2 Tax=Entamoeba nuttalli TaxID=412467 RepID=K2H358_ENTNP|nr:HEAT repeat domain containing protein [Entamoeba nuttalli P19]EKE41943.1 HEAT repeat domain containing protein [Entamoeba nuttalli P19]|eukprot:XP_008855722.1 HEAT repeat domain containing protein [Entamoeba nuttalli P19]
MQDRIDTIFKTNESGIKASTEDKRKKAIDSIITFSKEIQNEEDKKYFLNKILTVYKKTCSAIYMKIVISKILNGLENTFCTKELSQEFTEKFTTIFLGETNDELRKFLFGFVAHLIQYNEIIPTKIQQMIQSLNTLKEPLKSIFIAELPKMLGLPDTSKLSQVNLTGYFASEINLVKSPKNTPKTTIIAFRYLLAYYRQPEVKQCEVLESQLFSSFAKALKVYSSPEFLALIQEDGYKHQLSELLFDVCHLNCIPNICECEEDIKKILPFLLDRKNIKNFFKSTSTTSMSSLLIRLVFDSIMKDKKTVFDKLVIGNICNLMNSFVSEKVDEAEIPLLFIISSVLPPKRKLFNMFVFKIVHPTTKSFEIVKQFVIGNFDLIFNKIMELLQTNYTNEYLLHSYYKLLWFVQKFNDERETGHEIAVKFCQEIEKMNETSKFFCKLFIDTIKKNVNLFEKEVLYIVRCCNEISNKKDKEIALSILLAISGCLDTIVLAYKERLVYSYFLLNEGVGEDEKQERVIYDNVKEILSSLSEELEQPLNTATFYLLMPIFRWVISKKDKTTEIVKPQNQTMKLLQMHCEEITDQYPILEIAQLLNSIILVIPRFVQKTLTCLEQIVKVSDNKTLQYIFNNLLSEEENTRRYNAVALDRSKEYLRAKKIDHEELCKLYLGGHDQIKDVSNACRSVMKTIHLYCEEPGVEVKIPEDFRIPDQSFVEYYKKDEICLNENIDIQDMIATSIYSIAKIGKYNCGELLKVTMNEYDNSFPDITLVPGVAKDYLIIRSKFLRRRFCTFVIMKLGGLCSVEDMKELLPFAIKKLTNDEEPIPELVEEQGENMFSSRSRAEAEQIYDILVSIKKEKGKKNDKEIEMVGLFFGMIAKYLERDNPKFNDIIQQLRDLSVKPSLEVQMAVCNCFANITDIPNVQGMLEKMYAQCLRQKNFEIKRGIAYSIAGICKAHGLGVMFTCKFYDRFIKRPLEKFDVDKKGKRCTEGENLNINMTALITLQCICEIMGDIFEPYIIDVFNLVRPIVSEANQELRLQASATVRSMSSVLTHHGIGVTVPHLIDGLKSNEWRERRISCLLLGEMAKQTTHQLDAYLPKIITPLVNLMIDSDANVSEAASEALNNLASVIKNPEISSLIPSILDALENPPQNTPEFYEHFEKMQFTHLIDSSSLALIHYILLRGLSDPTHLIRAKSALLISSLTNLCDVDDFLPYLDIFIPELKKNITDNDPEVRAAASNAIGSLIQFVGEQAFPGVKQWIIETLQSTKSTVHRLGAAQALAEYYRAVGEEQLREDFNSITNLENPVITSRQSVMYLLYYFCSALKERFSDFIGEGLLLIVKGLSDSSELVRDAAMKAGSVLVRQFGKTHLKKLLETLDSAIYSDSPKVQECAINLIGELLEGMVDTNDASLEPYVLLKRKLGLEKIGECLANLYLIRFDEEHQICQKATLVWKKVIINAGRALSDLIPYIMKIATKKLCLEEKDRKRAARCLGELVDLFESKIVQELIKTLQSHLNSSNELDRIGACNGFVEVIRKSSLTTFEQFKGVLPQLVELMCDEVDAIREESNHLFNVIIRKYDKPSLEAILDILLGFINDEEQMQKGIRGLQMIIDKNHTNELIFETLTPKVLQVPITIANCKPLTILCKSSQQFFLQNFNLILQRGFNSLASKYTEESYCEKIRKMMIEICLEYPSKDKLFSTLGDYIASYQRSIIKIETLRILSSYFKLQTTQSSVGMDIIISFLMGLIRNEKDQDVVPYVWDCFEQMHMKVTNDKYYIYINALAPMIQDACQTPETAVLVLPKDIGPLVRVEIDTLKNALTETKEQAIRSLIVLLKRYENDSEFTKHRDNILGPLINIISKQCESSHKIKLLTLLQTIFATAQHRGKVKTFVLPITITLNKLLSEGDESVCKVAIEMYKYLIEYDLKIDTLLKEIQKGLSGAGTNSTKIKIYLQLLITCVDTIEPKKWNEGKELWAKTKKGTTWVVETLYFDIYNQCFQLIPLAQEYYQLLVRALATMLKFLPDNDTQFKTLLKMDGFSIETTEDLVVLRKELCNTYASVCPSKASMIKEAIKSI